MAERTITENTGQELIREMRRLRLQQELATRNGANILIRVARRVDKDTEAEPFFEQFLGQIVGQAYTEPGNLDWTALSLWVAGSIRGAMGQRLVDVDKDPERKFHLLRLDEQTPRKLVGKSGFISLLLAWKEGKQSLPYTPDGSAICIEFESTLAEDDVRYRRAMVEAGDGPMRSIEDDEPGYDGVSDRFSLPRGSVPPPERELRDAERHRETVRRMLRSNTEASGRSSTQDSEHLPPSQKDLGSSADDVSGDEFNPNFESEEEEEEEEEEVEEGGGHEYDHHGVKDDTHELINEAKEKSPDVEHSEAVRRTTLFDDLGAQANVNLKCDSDAHWDKVTELFLSQDSKTKKFRLPGLNFPLEHYQAAAVVWLLLRIHEDKVAAAMLADDMGLGKTFTMIAAIMVHYYTQLAFTEVKIFWHHLELGFQPPRNHNVQDAPEGQKCPSTQPNPVNLPNRFCLQCPCEAGSIARRIAESMSNMPSIIICPSKGATIWIEEWDKFVNSGMRRFEPMQLYVGISDYLEPKKLLADFCRDVVDGQLDDMGEQEVEGKLVFRRRTGFDGGSRHVLLLTQEATSRQLGQKPLFEKVNVTGLRANRAKNHEGNTQAIVGCAIMVMDELHEYKGATKTTGPFKFLEKFEHQVTPTLAVGLSGNALSIGPSGWRLLVQHTQRCIKRHQMQDVKLGRIAVSKAYSALTGDWNFIQENQDVSWRAPNMQNRVLGQVQLRKEKIRADFRDGIGKMIIRRTKKDMFRGQKILDLADPVYQEEQLMIPEGRALNSLRHYYQQIRHWALAEHKLMEQAWLDGGQKGPKPTLAKAQQGVLIEKNNDNTGESAAKKKGKGKGKGKGKDKDPDATKAAHEAFYRAVRAVTFPDLARVFRSHNGQDLRPYLESGNPDLGNIATMFTNVTLDPKRTDKAVGDMLKESPFHTYRTAIRSGSPKYAKLCELIKAQLIDTRKKSVDGKELRRNRDQPADDAPGDGSHVRHMVVFTDAPITAYLTALYLQGEFLGQVDVSLIHAGLPARSASAVKHWLSREATFKRFNENCRPDSKTKILVGTYQLIATMYNIQRASSAVLMDVGTEVERQQAQDRIYRRGQTCTVLITEVWYENHVYERTRRRRNKGTQQMSEINWDEFAIDNVGGDEGDSVLPQDTSGL